MRIRMPTAAVVLPWSRLIRKTALALVLTSLAPTPATAQADQLARRVDSLFAHLDTAPSPGVAIAVVRDGRVLLSRGYGMADLEHNIRITPGTVFDVASVSKQFAGLAIAMLAEQGKLSLDDELVKHIPEMRGLPGRVTIRHLLHHTSGLRDWPSTLAVAGWHFDDVISYDQILRMAYSQRTLNFAPGTEHMYSNTGYNLLAEVVQRATGETFRQWTTTNIFGPLGMTRSRFRDDHTEVVADRAFGYARTPRGFRHTPNNLTALGSSSMFSSVDDMAKWLLNFETARVGGPALLALRTRGALNDGSDVPYAWGVLMGSYRGLPMFTHSGGWASFNTFVAYLPEQKFGVVALANSSVVNAQDAVIRVTNIYLEKELGVAGASAGAVPANTAAAAQTADVPPQILDAYAGYYRLGPGWYTRITRDGARLMTQATSEQAVPMTARSEHEFWVEAYGASMQFQRDSTGRVTGLLYRGERAPRVVETPAPSADALQMLAGTYASDELHTSYRVAVENGALAMHHFRHGRIPLVHVSADEFAAANPFLRAITFMRDGAGKVTGLSVHAGPRSRDIRFRRVEP